jgi:hypothetical protein
MAIELLGEAPPGELVKTALWLMVMATAVLGAISFLLHFFVALKSPPERRAQLTTGIAYLLTGLMFIFTFPQDGLEFIVPVAAVPGALLMHWLWLNTFRFAWVDDESELAEGESLANDDWRKAVLYFAAALVAPALSWLLRNIW